MWKTIVVAKSEGRQLLMSEYQAGKDVQDLLKRMERLEKTLGSENDVESFIKISAAEIRH